MPAGTVSVALKLPDCVAMVCAAPSPLSVAVVFAVKPLPARVMVPPGVTLVEEAVKVAVPETGGASTVTTVVPLRPVAS